MPTYRDRTLSSTTTPGQSEPGSDGNKGVLRIPQSSSITGTSPSDCLLSYPGYSLEESSPLRRCSVGVFYSPSQQGGKIDLFKNYYYSIGTYAKRTLKKKKERERERERDRETETETERQRQRERKKKKEKVFVEKKCVCVREREREKKGEKKKEVG